MNDTTAPKQKAAVQCIAATLLLWAAKMMINPLIAQMNHSNGMEILILLTKTAIFLIPFLFLKATSKNTFCRTKPKSKQVWKCIGLVFPMMASSVLISNTLQFLWQKLGFDVNTQSLPKSQSVIQMMFLLFSLVCLPALAEEIIFRGEIQQRMLVFGSKTAVVCSAILFAAVHSHPIQIANAFVGGIFLGIAALVWGVKASIFLHFTNNLSALIFPRMEEWTMVLFWLISGIAAIGCLLYEVFCKKERTNLD